LILERNNLNDREKAIEERIRKVEEREKCVAELESKYKVIVSLKSLN